MKTTFGSEPPLGGTKARVAFDIFDLVPPSKGGLLHKNVSLHSDITPRGKYSRRTFRAICRSHWGQFNYNQLSLSFSFF